METNRSFAIPSVGSSADLPSGFEVESASFHSPRSAGIKGRVEELKSRASDLVDSAKCAIHDKVEEMKPVVNAKVSSLRSDVEQRVTSVREGVKSKSDGVQRDMAANPMKWAGISAGAGLALGLTGRLMQNRKRHERQERMSMPQLVIIDASC